MITSILTFKKVTDEPTCYKLFRWNLKDLLVCPNENGFEWEPAVTMLLFRKWYKYGEYPIHYKARKPEEWKKISFLIDLKQYILYLNGNLTIKNASKNSKIYR